MLASLFYKAAGVLFLILAKCQYLLKGYARPRPFPVSDYQRCVEHDFQVVDQWLSFLSRYKGEAGSIANREILELGPGADLGAGLYLLAKGAARYRTIDVNNLIAGCPPQFYDKFFEGLAGRGPAAQVGPLRCELELLRRGTPDRLHYVCRQDFDIAAAFAKASIDVVFSNAAFEHFEHLDRVIRQLEIVAKPGAVLVALIDLQTHSRWIRDKDPNNIYRYGERFYRALAFRGSPNRVRPQVYAALLRQHGWGDIALIPVDCLPDHDDRDVRSGLNRRFQGDENRMSWLSFMLCATKPPSPTG
jgi:SAM-dependent methyltransferase